MAGLHAWADLYRQAVSLEPYSGVDGYGNRTYGSATSYRARVVQKQKLVLNADGQQVISRSVCYLLSSVAVHTLSRLTLSTADAGSTDDWALHPPILAVERVPDENGMLYTALRLGGDEMRG